METESRQSGPVAAPAASTLAEPSQPSALLRFAWMSAGVALPPLCFAVGYPEPLQVKSLAQCAAALLAPEVSLPVYPLLVPCLVGLALLALWPDRYANNGWVQLGVFSGFVLSQEYWFVFQVAASETGTWEALPPRMALEVVLSLLAVFAPWYVARIVMFISKLLDTVTNGAGGSIICLLMLISLPVTIVVLIPLWLFCSTTWAVAAYATAAIWVVRHRQSKLFQFSLWQLFATMTWFAVDFAAWRTATLIMLERTK
jgi:hypothetical protein